MGNYVDIHCHMLGGTDDGAGDDMEMFKMLDEAYACGTRAICLTPHYNPGVFGDNSERGRRAFALLEAYASEKYGDMKLYLGNELYFYSGGIDALVSGKCRTLNDTKYVLVDFSFDSQYHEIRNSLLDLLNSGFRPVFAHVERYDCIKPPFRELDELKRYGIKIQINSTSLCGGWGRSLQKKALRLIKQYIPDIAASDAHDLVYRSPQLEECEGIIEKNCGSKYADALLRVNPSKIIGINYSEV